MYLAAPPRKKLKVGGGQDEGDAAARASCLPRVMVISLFSLQKNKLSVIMAPSPQGRPADNWEGWFPLGCRSAYEWQCAAWKVLYHFTDTATVFLSEP